MIKNCAGGRGEDIINELLASSIQYLDLYIEKLNVPIVPIQQVGSVEYYVCK
jgi:hypothetical protein